MKHLILILITCISFSAITQSNLLIDTKKLFSNINPSFENNLLLNFENTKDIIDDILKIENISAVEELEIYDQINHKNVRSKNNEKSLQNEVIELLDSCYFYIFDGSIQEMRFDQKCVDIHYNDDFKITDYTRKIWTNNSWENFRRTNFYYDDNGNLNEYTLDIWDNTEWTKKYHVFREINNHNDLTNLTLKEWTGTEWVTILIYHFEIVYNSNNQMTDLQISTGSIYTGYGGDINLTVQRIYHFDYNVNDDLITISAQVFNGSYFQNYRFTGTYDINTNLVNILGEKLENSTWINIGQINNSYNASNLLYSTSFQLWNNNNWINHIVIDNILRNENNLVTQYRLFYYLDQIQYFFQGNIKLCYDNNDNVIKIEIKKITQSGYLDYQENILHYDSNNYLTDETYSRKDDECQFIITAQRRVLYWHIPIIENMNVHSSTALNELNSNKIISIYPNPSDGIYFINTDLDIEIIEVFDIKGTKISFLKNQNNSIDLKGFSDGIYILKLKTKDSIYVRNLILK